MPEEDGRRGGTIITMFSARGSTGKTTIAINLAVALAQETGQRVSLVDLDARFGDVSIQLDIPVERSLVDLVTRGDEITKTTLEQCVYAHKTGVSVLTASIRPSEWRSIRAEHIERIVPQIRGASDYVVLDTASTFNDIVVAELELADVILLVTTADESCLNETRVAIELLRSESLQDKTKLLINATSYATDFEPHGVEETLGQKVFWRLPYELSISTMELGTLLVVSNPDSAAAKSIVQLARLLAGGQVESTSEGSADAPEQAKSLERDAEDWTLADIWGEPVQTPKPFVPALRMHREIVRAWIQLSEFPGFDWKDLFENAGTQDPTQYPEWHINFHDLVEGYARKEAAWNAAFQALMQQAQTHQPTEISARHTAQHALIKILLLILVGKAKPGHEAKLREAEDWLRRCAEQDFPEALARIVRNPVSHDYTIVMRRPG